MRKKLMAGVVAGTLALGSMGGAIYAYSDSIKEGIDKLVQKYTPQIQEAIMSHKDELVGAFPGWVQSELDKIDAGWEEYKDKLIAEGNAEIDAYVAQLKEEAKQELDKQKQEGEQRLQQVKEEAVAQAKEDIQRKIGEAPVQAQVSKKHKKH